MADGKFKKGHKGGPGRPQLPEDLRTVKKLTPDFVHRLIAKYGRMNVESIEKMTKDPKSIALDVMVGMIILKAIKDGDHQRLNFLFDRTIGKVLQQMEVQMPEPLIVRGKSSGREVLLTAKTPEGEIIDAEVTDE